MIRALLFISICFIFSHPGYGDSKKSLDNVTSYSYGEQPSMATMEEALKNYHLWKRNFIVQEGEFTRVKWVNPEQTTSEGIGWGMLLAVYANDAEVFEGLWNYYTIHRNAHGLMHAKIDAVYGIVSYNALPGADIDACMALIAAIKQWPEKAFEYHTAATDLLSAIRKYEIDSTNYTIRGTDQPASEFRVNMAYFSPAHFRVFGEFSNDVNFWNQVADNCYHIINENLKRNNACGGLVSDRTNVSGQNTTSNNNSFLGGKTYYYDAARVPLRVALDYLWTGNPDAKDYLNRCNDFVFVRLGGAENIVDGYTQDGTATGNYHNSSFVGPFACAAMTGYNSMYLNTIYSDLVDIDDGGSFYNQSVKTLSLFMLAGLFSRPVESLKHHSGTTLLSETEENGANLVAPNPFLDQAILNLPAGKDVYPLAYEIIDEQGIVYESSKINSSNQAIGGGLSSGTYLMQITYAGKIKVVRLHKK